MSASCFSLFFSERIQVLTHVALPAEILAKQIVAHSDIMLTPLSPSADGDGHLVLKCCRFRQQPGNKSGSEDGSNLAVASEYTPALPDAPDLPA
jgi:hypothetical protein